MAATDPVFFDRQSAQRIVRFVEQGERAGRGLPDVPRTPRGVGSPAQIALANLGISFPLAANNHQGSFLTTTMPSRSATIYRASDNAQWESIGTDTIYNFSPFIHTGLLLLIRSGGKWLVDRNIQQSPHWHNGIGLGTDYGGVATGSSTGATIVCPVTSKPFWVSWNGYITVTGAQDATHVSATVQVQGQTGTAQQFSTAKGTVTVDPGGPNEEDLTVKYESTNPAISFSFNGSGVFVLSKDATLAVVASQSGGGSATITQSNLSILPLF